MSTVCPLMVLCSLVSMSYGGGGGGGGGRLCQQLWRKRNAGLEQPAVIMGCGTGDDPEDAICFAESLTNDEVGVQRLVVNQLFKDRNKLASY